MIFAFPIGVEKDLRRTPWLTYFLILLNAAVYITQYVVLPEWLNKRPEFLFEKLGFQAFGGEAWRALTYSFIHSTLYDLLINMLFLFLLGIAVEDTIGRWKMALLYLLGGLGGAAIFDLLTDSASPALIAGSLAPVTALAAAYLVIMPHLNFTIGYGYWFVFWSGVGTVALPAIILIILYFIQAHLPAEAVLRDVLPILRELSILRQADLGFSYSILYPQLGGMAVGLAFGLAAKFFQGFSKSEEEEAAHLAEEIEKKRIAQELAAAKSPGQRVGLDEILSMPESESGPPPDPALLALLVSSRQGQKVITEYTNWLRKDPRASLAPDPQTDLAKLLIEQGAQELAFVALNNLIDRYPKTSQAKAALLMAGEVASEIPSKRTNAFGLLNRFLASAPSRADQEKAQQILTRLQKDLLVVDTQEFRINMDADFSEKTRKREKEDEALLHPTLSNAEAPIALNLQAESFNPVDREEALPGKAVEEKKDDVGPISLDDIITARKKEKDEQKSRKIYTFLLRLDLLILIQMPPKILFPWTQRVKRKNLITA